MAFQYHKIKGWAGLSNRKDARDIGNGLSKAQNISLDIGGKIRTIGGLADFTKVDGATALTQTAKLCPGSGLFPYGSDHWRGTGTVVDLLSQLNAASDHDADNDGPNATTGWTAIAGSGTLASVGDTDGTTIATNFTTYILKLTNSTDAAYVIGQSATTVIGQRYILSADLYNLDATDVELFVGTTSGGGEYGTRLHSAASWSNHILEFVATTTTVHISFWSHSLTGEIVYIDDVYLSKIPRSDLDTNWLSLVDAANAQVDLYNINDDAFAAGLLDFGTVFSYVATIDTINFPTTKTITDSTSQFLNQGIQAGDIRINSGCTSETANNIMFVVEHVTAGTITARGNPFTIQADENGTVTLTKYNPVAFHYVNEALRASPANGGIALRPKHYSFADRTHFEGALSSERKFSNWFANDVGPVAPTDVEATTGNGDGAATNLTAGAGFEIGITRTADDGDWIAGTYIIACAFRYDNGQVSTLFVPSTDEEFGTAILDSDSLTLTVRAKNDYDERISGGYIFCRKDESDDAWILLAEMSMADGARATLLGTYNAWAESDSTGSGAVDVAYTANFKSLHPNVDSYESISGIDPTTKVEVFTGDNAFWNASVIGGNRCFIFAPRYTDAGGNLQQFRDRIMYSQVNAYDTFPIDNIVDVVKGDAEDYVMGGIYGNDLLCFKSRTLYIIDISDPDPVGWQMKQDRNKGKYPFRGVKHPGAYFETPIGPAWCNEFGVFLYNGSEIVPLLGDKIELSEHPLAYQRYMEFATDDYVEKDSATILPTTYPFSLEAWIKISSISATMQFLGLADKDAPDEQARIAMFSTGKCFAAIQNTGSEDSGAQTDAADDGLWHHVVAVFASATDRKIYLDAGTPGTDTTSVTMSLNIDRLSVGRFGGSSPGSYLTGGIAGGRVWNRDLSSAEITNLLNGVPIAVADQWGDDTTLNTDTIVNSGSGAHDYNTFANATATGFDGAGVSASGAFAAIQPNITTASKNFVIVYDLVINSGTAPYIKDTTSSTTLVQLETGTGKIARFTTSAAPEKIYISHNAGETADFEISNIKIAQVGVVVELLPKNITDASWVDSSDNALTPTVVGATAIYEDSWAKFYTDYSILGYHARTNQLIINRDCTGKWSSGQDYGDCWIIDIDTGAITTGRRVFTKGIAYSNWTTDWNQELIIAEQTSSTSVTIKRWTDEPQSQAAGLIDIRTADIDFGNPMFAKIFDAFVTTYKSSAAQTTPVSYSTNGNDLNTAWTRLTGNFSASEIWKKLSLQPTPVTADTIRFKIDAPTAAGTLEINDMGIRFSEEPEDID